MGRGRGWSPSDPGAPGPGRPPGPRAGSGLEALGFRVRGRVAEARAGRVRCRVDLEAGRFSARIPGVVRRLRLGPEERWAELLQLAGVGDLQVGHAALDRAARIDGDAAVAMALSAIPELVDDLVRWIPRGLTLRDGLLVAPLPSPSSSPRASDLRAEVAELMRLAGRLQLEREDLVPLLVRYAALAEDPLQAATALGQVERAQAGDLAELLQAHLPAVRRTAVERFGPADLRAMAGALRDESQPDEVRLAALGVLERAEAWPEVADAAPADGAVRRAWAGVVRDLVEAEPGRLDGCGEDALLALVDAAGGALRLRAIAALGARGTGRAVAPLVALSSGILVLPGVRRAAREALAELVARVGVAGGELSLVDGAGALAAAEDPPGER